MHYLLTGRVCGWDEDAVEAVEADTVRQAIDIFLESLRALEKVACGVAWQKMLDDGEVFINSIHESDTHIRVAPYNPLED